MACARNKKTLPLDRCLLRKKGDEGKTERSSPKSPNAYYSRVYDTESKPPTFAIYASSNAHVAYLIHTHIHFNA